MNVMIYVRGMYNPEIGGATGYVSRLKKALDNTSIPHHGDVEIDFFFDGSNQQRGLLKRLVNRIFSILTRIQRTLFSGGCSRISHELSQRLKDPNLTAVHAHRVDEFIMLSDYLESNNILVKKILTFHNPIPPSEEKFDRIHASNCLSKAEKAREQFRLLERKAVEKADILIFPCAESLHGYPKYWGGFNEAIKGKEIQYLMTGIDVPTVKMSRTAVCKKYGIPQTNLIIGYTGRHNSVKGYDLLVDAAKKILEGSRNITFLIAGTQFPMVGLEHPSWIEVGWTDDPASIINSCDLFILPNRETYFDIVLLEAMALSKCIIASSTGGNLKVKSLCDSLLLFSPDSSSILAKKILDVIKNPSELYLLGQKNRTKYELHFTSKAFSSEYLSLISKVSINTKSNL